MIHLQEMMNEILDDKLCEVQNGYEYGGLVEAVGNDDGRLARTIYLLIPDNESLRDAFHAYFGTDTQAQEKLEAQRHSDWIDSGLSRGGLIKRVA